MSCNRSFPYVQISKFGTTLNPKLSIDPVAASIYKDPDASFDIGATAYLYGPARVKSQLYMAEKCSKNWDGACEFLSRNQDTSKPNTGKIASPLFTTVQPPGKETIGDYLVENASVRRFCDLSSCAITQEPFDPTNPNSVWVSSYGCCGDSPCLPVCLPPENPDEDLLLNKVLDKPDLHIDLLVNMYKNVNKNGTRENYRNTRVGHIFNILDVYVKLNKRK